MAEADNMLRTLVAKLKAKRMRASDLFKSIDASGDMSLSTAELRAGLKDLGFAPSEEDFAILMGKIDKDGSGEVSLKEFEKVMRYAEKLPPPPPPKKEVKRARGLTDDDREEFRQVFCLFKQLCRAREHEDADPQLVALDDSGSISADELEQLLETVGLKLRKRELEAIIKEIDKDGNGEIDFEEFCDSMTKKMQVDHKPDDVEKSFKSFARNAPEGLIRVQDLRNAMLTYMHKDLNSDEVDELLATYKDTFITIAGSDQKYFNYQAYCDLISPTE